MAPSVTKNTLFDIYNANVGNCMFISLGLCKRYLDTGETPRLMLVDHNADINKNIPSILYTDYSVYIICNILSNLCSPNSKTARIKNLLKKNLYKTRAEVLARLFVDSITAKNITYFIRLCKIDIQLDILWLLFDNITKGVMPASINGHIKKFKGNFIRNNVDNAIIENTIQLMQDGVDIYTIDDIYRVIYALNNADIYEYFNKYFAVKNKAKYEYPKRIRDEIAAVNQLRQEACPTDSMLKYLLNELYPNINTSSKLTTILNKICPTVRDDILLAIYSSKNKYKCSNTGTAANAIAFAYRHNLNINIAESISKLRLPDICAERGNVKLSYNPNILDEYNQRLYDHRYAQTAKNIANAKKYQRLCSSPIYTIQANKLNFIIVHKRKDAIGTINIFGQDHHAMPMIPK